MFDKKTLELAQEVVNKVREKDGTLTTAESCTGGLISAAITDVSGSSRVFNEGFVTYANGSKQKLVGVSALNLEKCGAVSEEVVKEMAEGALKAAKANYAIATSGIAGPTGGTKEKPVGLVYIAVASRKGVKSHREVFSGDRNAVRMQATQKALQLLLDNYLR